MTPEEMNGLLIFGTHVTKNVAVLIFIAIVYGICLCITPVAFTALLRRERTRQTIYQLVIGTFLFCIMSLYTASVGQLVIWQISQTLSHLDEGLSARLMHVDNTSIWNFILDTWMQPIQVKAVLVYEPSRMRNIPDVERQFIAGDAVIVWRAWVFWRDSHVVHVVLGIFLLADIVISIFAGVYATERILVSLDEPSLGANLASAAVFLSFGANFVSTLLTAIKARQHRKMMRDAFPTMSKTSANNRITRNEGILFILVESGAVLCAAQFVYAILALVDTVNLSPVDWARSFLALFCQLLANLNPILVIIIVRLRLSVIDKTTLHLTTMSEAHSQGAHPSHENEDVERHDKAAPWPSGTTGVPAARRETSSLSEVASARDRVSGEKGDVGETADSARDSFNETPEVEAKSS